MKITIITVAYNAENEIEKTIKSVLYQSSNEYEYIIVDGKSSDNTVTIAESFQNAFNRKKVNYKIISEKDAGIYDAMNKGVSYSSGQWIIFMNSGDVFYSDDTIKKIIPVLQDNYGVVYGETLVRSKYGDYLRETHNPDVLPYDIPFCHQSVFTKKQLLVKHPFSLELKICSDLLFYSLCYEEKRMFKRVTDIISIYDASGLSSVNQKEATKERYIVLKQTGKNSIKEIIKYYTRIFVITIKDSIKRVCPEAILNRIRRRRNK